MLVFSQTCLKVLSLPIPTVFRSGTNEILPLHYDAADNQIGKTLVRTEGDTTSYWFFDAVGIALGSVAKQVRGNTLTIRIFDSQGGLVSQERTIVRGDYTLVETWDVGGFTGAVKEIHTATRTGVQVYDADWNLVAASLKSDDGNGVTRTAEYGPEWFVIHRETVTVKDNVTTTVIEENGAGNITGGTKVTVKSDFTLTETYGAKWALTGAVKEIHTATRAGVQVYDADWNLVAASLKSDDGNGVTRTAEYGPEWTIISQISKMTTGAKVVTELPESADASLTGYKEGYWGPDVEKRSEVVTVDLTLTNTAGRDDIVDVGGKDSSNGRLRMYTDSEALEVCSCLIATQPESLLSDSDDSDVFVFKFGSSTNGANEPLSDIDVDEILSDVSDPGVSSVFNLATHAEGALITCNKNFNGIPEISFMYQSVFGSETHDII